MIAALLLAVALADEPLTLERLREAVDARVPELAAAEAELLAVQAEVLAAAGAFDPTLSAVGGAYTGKDPRRFGEVALTAPTRLGPELEVGYRVGTGSFPTYDARETAEDGEVRLGLTVPLLDELWLGEARGGLLDAELAVTGGQAALADARVAVRVRAERAWWKWVAAGEKRRIAQAQLDLATSRAEALAVQVREGARSELERLDNERVLYERRAALAEAERALEVAAVELSLWWRDAAGDPQVPGAPELPRLDDPRLAEVDAALARRRPDVEAKRAGVERAALAERLAGNGLLPVLDGKVQWRQDLADEPAEWVVGAAFELPLYLRAERGGLAKASARRVAAEAELRAAEDRATAELEAALRAREAAREQRQWRLLALERAEQVRALQARSWELGAADLFLLLQREEKLAEAGEKAVDATVDLALADLAVRAAVAQP